MNYLSEVVANILPSTAQVALCIKVALFGAIGGYLSNAAAEFLKEKNPEIVVNGFKSNLKFILLGGICAMLAQVIDGSDKILILQALTIGATWPRIVNRFKKQNDFDSFVNSGQDVPVERSK